MRLARFNVLSRREEAAGQKKPGKYTLGLAIPAAASVLVFMVLVAHHAGPYKLVSESVVAGVVLALSYLMVSRIRFRSFKDLRLTRRTVELAVILAGSWVIVAMNGVSKALIFLVLMTAYIILGLAETVLQMRRRFIELRQEKPAQAAAQPRERRRATKKSCASSAPSTTPTKKPKIGESRRASRLRPSAGACRPPRRRRHRPRRIRPRGRPPGELQDRKLGERATGRRAEARAA